VANLARTANSLSQSFAAPEVGRHMQVYFVRHGDAATAESDSARTLTLIGRAQAAGVARFLQRNGAVASAVWHSAKTRARETAEIIARDAGLAGDLIQKDGLMPEDPHADIARAIDSQSDDLLVVGHLPQLAYLASSLLTGADGRPFVLFENATAVCIERNGRSRWHLKWMISPAQLSE
jgi:phosphohistidine phosphatase